MKKLFKNSKGFTLIELMVVITIMSILAGIVVPQVTGSVTTGKGVGSKSNLQNIQQAVDRYAGDNKDLYPIDTSGAAAPALGTAELTLVAGGNTFYLRDIVWDAAAGTKKFVPDYLHTKPSQSGDTIGDVLSGATTELASGTGTITINGTAYTVTFASATTKYGVWAIDQHGTVWRVVAD